MPIPLVNVVTNLSHVIANNDGVYGPENPVMLAAVPTVRNSSIMQQAETESIMVKMVSSVERASKAALEMKENEEAPADVGILRNLSSPMKEGNTIAAGYMNYNPPHTSQVDGRTSGVIIPEWMPILFRPPKDMILDEIEAAVALYLFGTNKDDNNNGKEVIVKGRFANGERRHFKCLIPKGMVDQEILTLVACMQTYEECDQPSCWFLPTTFSQYVLDWSRSPKAVMGYYQDDFMGKIELLSKIFVPINDGHLHWYLLVVDLKQKLLVILDSKPNPTLSELKRRNIKKLALFMEEMFQHNSFYEFRLTPKPLISEFKIKEAEGVGEQLPGSNDCGVWVAMWMKECAWTNDYKISVTQASRMRIALDLVLKPFNKRKDKIISKAFANIKSSEEKRRNLVKI
ncbi:Ulp1 protease family, C-terminal catalytic domain [Sesbania bispinosa]|nr:Ulp1 protease family, C-terminal catalytic domain [Sesbania bispinosa]